MHLSIRNRSLSVAHPAHLLVASAQGSSNLGSYPLSVDNALSSIQLTRQEGKANGGIDFRKSAKEIKSLRLKR